MKNKKALIIIIAVAVIAALAIIGYSVFSRTSSVFSVENNEDGTISVMAQNAGKNSGGLGYITLEEGQKLSVRTNLTDNSSIKIEVLPAEIDATTKVLFEETFTAIDARQFEMPAGDYTIRITAEKGATGSMDISAK